MNFDFSCLVSLQSIFLTCMAIRVVGGACPVHEEKRGVVNLTYKAIVSFTRIAANVHTECPTNVETLPWREEKELFVTDFSVFFFSLPLQYLYICPDPQPPTHTLLAGTSQEGTGSFYLQVFRVSKVLNCEITKGDIVHDKQASTWPKVLRDRRMGVWLTQDDPDAAVLHFCSPVCCVFRGWSNTWVFVPWFSCMCASGGWSLAWYVCVYLYTSLCEYCIP